jgi:hypothetical protein
MVLPPARRLPELTSRPWNDWKIQNLGMEELVPYSNFLTVPEKIQFEICFSMINL